METRGVKLIGSERTADLGMGSNRELRSGFGTDASHTLSNRDCLLGSIGPVAFGQCMKDWMYSKPYTKPTDRAQEARGTFDAAPNFGHLPRLSGRSRMQDPLVSQSLPRLGCLCWTFSPSRCQIRSTRLSLIIQPAWRAAVRRSCDSHSGRIAEHKLDNIGGETLLVLTTDAGSCVVSSDAARAPRRRDGDMQLRSHLLNAGTATRGA